MVKISAFILSLLAFTVYAGTAELWEGALQQGNIMVIKELLDTGIDPNEILKDGSTPLQVAIVNNQKAAAELLMNHSADPNKRHAITQATALHLSAVYGRAAIATSLLQHGANINASMKFGITPLLTAVKFNQLPVIELLLKNKVNVNQVDDEGYSALHLAAENNNTIVAELLLEHNANPLLPDHARNTPLAIAEQRHNYDLAQILRGR